MPVPLVCRYVQNNTCSNNLMLITKISALRVPEGDGAIAARLKQNHRINHYAIWGKSLPMKLEKLCSQTQLNH